MNSEAKVYDSSLQASEFQKIFRFSNDAVAITDRDGRILDVNQAFLDTYGYTLDELLGENPSILKSKYSTDKLYEIMWADILNPEKGFWKGDIINVRKDGTEVPVNLSINAIIDASGEIVNFLGIAFDMSAHKELERMRTLYMNYIMHDIRSPLAALKSNAETVLLSEKGLSEQGVQKLRSIMLSAERVELLASNILDDNRALDGSLRINKSSFSPHYLIKDTLLTLFPDVDKRITVNGLEYSEWEGDDTIEIEADFGKLQRVAYNLVSNGLKNACEEIMILAEVTDEGFNLTVSDDGHGLAAVDCGTIFDAFKQTEEGVSRGGVGLGLSIVKTFVELHGGNVWVSTAEGSGSAFGIFIPSGDGNSQGRHRVLPDMSSNCS